jgi:hypothetical protein
VAPTSATTFRKWDDVLTAGSLFARRIQRHGLIIPLVKGRCEPANTNGEDRAGAENEKMTLCPLPGNIISRISSQTCSNGEGGPMVRP